MARQPTLMERFAAELLGTFLLVFVGGGAAASATLLLHRTNQPSTMADVVLVALAHGFVLFIIVMIVGKVSGAHVNPTVTIGLASIGRFPWEEVIGYVVAQLIGAIAGAAAILIIEGLGTFILVLTIVATAVDSRAPAGWAGLAIGMALAAVILFLGPASGATVNPARALGPDLVSGLFFGVNVDWLAYLICYLAGPLVGGIGACWLYRYVAHLPRQTGRR